MASAHANACAATVAAFRLPREFKNGRRKYQARASGPPRRLFSLRDALASATQPVFSTGRKARVLDARRVLFEEYYAGRALRAAAVVEAFVSLQSGCAILSARRGK